jgi:hypothetical protein
MNATSTSTSATTECGAATDVGAPVALDITVAGIATVRLVGAQAADRAAVERQFGPSSPASDAEADVTVRYVDRLDDDQLVRYLGPGVAGYTDDDFLILQGRFRRAVKVRLPGVDIGRRCEVRCEHGVGRVPHLVALVNLALLARGGVALHASAFARAGRATVATGWSKGGKTEALLAACDAGAAYVADEWTHIDPRRRASGSWEPVRVWDWQLAQLPWLHQQLGRRDRTRLRALGAAEHLAARGRAGARATTTIARNRFVDVPPELVARGRRPSSSVPIEQLLLMTATDRGRTWARRSTGREVADRMAASLTYERAPLAAIVTAYRFAFPTAITRTFDDVAEIERERLRSLLDSIPATEVLHPYPVDLAELGRALSPPPEEAPE